MTSAQKRQKFPGIIFVGVHMEATQPFRHLIDSGENILGLATLTAERCAETSGAVDLASIAQRAGIEVLRVQNINDPEAVEWIQRRAPDVLLVVGWTQLVRDRLLGVPKVACLGFHASLLPQYRGRAPVNWAIIHGEAETGNTMIVLGTGADEGDIVSQRRIAIGREDDCRSVYEKVGATEVEMLEEVLPLIRAGKLPRARQDSSLATVLPARRPRDGIIDWRQTAERLYDWIRAQTHPYPGAFTFIHERKVWIWRGTPLPEDGQSRGLRPGTTVVDPEGWPLVAAGRGWIKLVSIQAEGEAEISAQDAVFELLEPGAVLGSPEAGPHR